MERTFEAHYSKHGAWPFLAMAILFIVGIVLFSVFWVPDVSLGMIIVLFVCTVIFLWVFINTLKKEGVAVSVENGNIVLHKKEKITIPLTYVVKVTMSNATSLDLSVKHINGSCSLHCFIKDQRKKKQELIQILSDSGIEVVIVDTSWSA